jgi:thiamine-phosphate pyrophosphorylase
MKKNADLSVYAILDIDYISSLHKDWIKSLKDTLKGGATAVQLRSKIMDDALFYDAASRAKKICAAYGALFVVNDRVDTAIAVEAGGVHVGSSDLPFFAVKKLVKNTVIIGVSASTAKESIACEKLKADYIGIGPVYATGQKDTRPMGPDTMTKIMKKISTPVVAIGGINSYNIPELKKAGVKNFSFISAIFSADDIREKTRGIKLIIESKEI